jgi:putative FmdB family regulatory protein
MPIYEYLCEECEKIFTVTQHMTEHDETGEPPPCPKCDSDKTHQIFSTFFAKTSTKS